MNEIQLRRQSGSSVIHDSGSPAVVDSMSSPPKSCTSPVVGNPIGTTIEIQHDNLEYTSPLALRSPPSPGPVVASLSSTIVDDPGNLSDLTDLPTEIDSSPRSRIIVVPAPETPDKQRPMKRSLSQSSTPATSSNTQRVAGKSRLVFDGVEITQPQWFSWRREKKSSSSQRKRKRNVRPLSPDVTETPDSDYSPMAAQEIPSRSLSKRKRKMSQGPASR